MIYFDLETTGLLLPPQADLARQPRIVQAAWAVDDGEVQMMMCNPGIPIPIEASRIHGITDVMVGHAAEERELVEHLVALIRAYPEVCAYNIGFDLTVLAYAAARHFIPWPKSLHLIDPMLVAEDRFGTRLKLVDLHEKLVGYRPAKAHDAAADVESLRRVHQALIA